MASIPSPQELWGKHEQLVLEVFLLALEMLMKKTDLPRDEPGINEALALKTRQANFSLNQHGRGLLTPPNWERPKQPAVDADLGKTGKTKRPDFSCTIVDNNAQSYVEAYREFHVECKRLGEPSNAGWNFNKNYVTNGIHRFVNSEHRYGERAFSGAMIGYIQSMEVQSLLAEINDHLVAGSDEKLPPIDFLRDDSKKIIQTSQQLIRKLVAPSHFELHHIWVDLRR